MLGETAGVDREKLLEAIGASVVGSRFVEYKTEPLLDEDYSATFTTTMMLKDVGLVLDLASERGVDLPFTRPPERRCSRTPSSAGTETRTSSRSSAGCGKRASRSQRRQGTGEPVTTNIASRGATMAVDWEQRIDFAKLRADRLARAKAALAESDLGALLLFDPNNIRYVTSTHIGEWARDKNARWVLLPRGHDPILWDFGSAARHHRMYAPWLPEENFRAGVAPMRGAMPDETGIPDSLALKIAARAARARPRGRAARHRHVRPGHDRGPAARGHRRSPTARA